MATTLMLLLLSLLRCCSLASLALGLNPIDVVTRDFRALTRRVTAHHILLPKSRDVALALKQRIRNEVSPPTVPSPSSSPDYAFQVVVQRPAYIVDAFSSAAKKYSREECTASEGGLLGTLVPQGYCRAPELDRACFEVPLGEICGPIESEYGYHLLLVVERTNCKAIDGNYTKIVRGEDGTSKKFVAGDDKFDSQGSLSQLALQQIGFWVGVSLAGGIVAEMAAKAADVVESLPWD
jgi:hypothetical protein